MANKNIDFNFEEYAVNTIRHIDSLRSILTFFGPDIVKEDSLAKPRESRINAFYRSVGLPAVIPKEIETDKTESIPIKDEFNNGNIHSDLDFKDYETDLNLRQDSFNIEPKEEEIEQLLRSNAQSLDSSIETDDDKNTIQRSRGMLFPMVVDGRIHVKPQRNRVAGAFMSDDDRKSKTSKDIVHYQPLIETILYIKLRGKNIVNTVAQDAQTDDFNTENIQNLQNPDLLSLTKLDADADERLTNTLKCIASVLRDTVQKLGRVRKKTGREVNPNAVAVAQQDQKTRVVDSQLKPLDRQKIRQDDKQAIADAILSLFEYDTVDRRNIRGGPLAGSLINILTPEEKSVSKTENDSVKKQLDKEKLAIKVIYRSVELLFGTFSGISGTDILAITTALYRLDTDYLIDLLNKDAQARLSKIKKNRSLCNRKHKWRQ